MSPGQAFYYSSPMFHDVPWCSMMFHDVPWCSMMFHDVPWCSMMFHDVPWCSMMFHDVPWCSMMFHDVPWCSMMFHDVPWCSMMFHDVPWCSMMFHDVPWYTWSVFTMKLHVSLWNLWGSTCPKLWRACRVPREPQTFSKLQLFETRDSPKTSPSQCRFNNVQQFNHWFITSLEASFREVSQSIPNSKRGEFQRVCPDLKRLVAQEGPHDMNFLIGCHCKAETWLAVVTSDKASVWQIFSWNSMNITWKSMKHIANNPWNHMRRGIAARFEIHLCLYFRFRDSRPSEKL